MNGKNLDRLAHASELDISVVESTMLGATAVAPSLLNRPLQLTAISEGELIPMLAFRFGLYITHHAQQVATPHLCKVFF